MPEPQQTPQPANGHAQPDLAGESFSADLPFRRDATDATLHALRERKVQHVIASEQIEFITRGTVLYHYTVPVNNLPPALQGAQLLHLTDVHFHATRWRRTRAIEALADHLERKGIQIDALLLTGDVISSVQDEFDFRAMLTLRRMAPEGRRFFVLGNHDYYARSERNVRQKLNMIGYRDLTNRGATLAINGAPLQLFGLDDFQLGKPDGRQALALAPEFPTVLLTHNIDALTRSLPDRFDLVLSGHLHAGEIRLFGKDLTDYKIKLGRFLNRNGHVLGWDALSDRALSYVSPGHARHSVRFNTEYPGGALLKLMRS